MNEKNKRGTANNNSGNDNLGAGMQLSLPIAERNENEGKEKVTSNTATVDQGKDFEATLSELESVVQQLEGEVKLEEALKLFDRGMKLSTHCEDFLKTAEQKIEILKRAANGTLNAEKFNEEVLQNS